MRGWRKLAPVERAESLQLLLLLTTAAAGLHLRGYESMRRWAEHAIPDKANPGDIEEARRCALLLERVARHVPFDASCLRKSLALCRFLRARGWPARVCVGARGGISAFEAHAWVQVGGEVLPPGNEGFSPFPP